MNIGSNFFLVKCRHSKDSSKTFNDFQFAIDLFNTRIRFVSTTTSRWCCREINFVRERKNNFSFAELFHLLQLFDNFIFLFPDKIH